MVSENVRPFVDKLTKLQRKLNTTNARTHPLANALAVRLNKDLENLDQKSDFVFLGILPTFAEALRQAARLTCGVYRSAAIIVATVLESTAKLIGQHWSKQETVKTYLWALTEQVGAFLRYDDHFYLQFKSKRGEAFLRSVGELLME